MILIKPRILFSLNNSLNAHLQIFKKLSNKVNVVIFFLFMKFISGNQAYVFNLDYMKVKHDF